MAGTHTPVIFGTVMVPKTGTKQAPVVMGPGLRRDDGL
jgi:hypothetical protein